MPIDRSKTTSPTQHRGDIGRGLMGDKTAGFDPAAVPMETDAEAGDAGSSPSGMSEAREAPSPAVDVNATSHGTAMRPNGEGKEEQSIFAAYVLAILALAVGLGILIALTFTD